MTKFISKRSMIFRDLTKKPLGVKDLAKKFGITPPTVRKHISLLREEGKTIRYDSRDKRYYTPQAIDREQRIKNSITKLAKDWNPNSTIKQNPNNSTTNRKENVEAELSKTFEQLMEKVEDVEKKASELILRFLLLNTDLHRKCTTRAIAAYLELEEDLVKCTLDILVDKLIVLKMTREGIETWYRINEKEGFIQAIQQGLLTLTPIEVQEILDIRVEDREGFSTEGALVNAWGFREKGREKIRWIPQMVNNYFIPGLQSAFKDAASIQQPLTGIRKEPDPTMIDHSTLMPPILARLERIERPEDNDLGAEWSLVSQLLQTMSQPDPTSPPVDVLLWKLLGFKDTPNDEEIKKAEKRRKEAELRYLLAYYRCLYERLDKEGITQFFITFATNPQKDPAREAGRNIHIESVDTAPSWILPCFLAMLSVVFKHALTLARNYDLDPSTVKHLEEYQQTFWNASRYGE